MAERTGALPSGVDPSDPGMSGDASPDADRAAAINAETKKWRDNVDTQKKQTGREEAPATPEELVNLEQDFDE